MSLLARRGGYLITPESDEPIEPIPGIRVIHPEIPIGASRDQIQRAISAETQRFVAQSKPSLVHCLDVESASAALIGGRGRIPLVIEPGATPAQLTRAGIEVVAAAQIKDLVALEDKILRRANVVIAQNQLEAATLSKRGVAMDRIHIAIPGVKAYPTSGPAPELPALTTIITGEPDRDLTLLNAALLRLKYAWRLVVFFEEHCLPSAERHAQFDMGIRDFIEFVPIQSGWEHRLRATRFFVSAAPRSRPLDAGSWCPESVYHGLRLGRAIIAPEHPSLRCHAGPAPLYYAQDDPAALAEVLSLALSTVDISREAAKRSLLQSQRLNWSQSNMLVDALWASIFMDEGSI